jgi:hypothetical protein
VTNTEFVLLRLEHMEARPEMWAASKESFGMQLLLLLEFFELETPQARVHGPRRPTMRLIASLFGPGPAVPTDPLTPEWAKEKICIVRKEMQAKEVVLR